MINWKIRLRNKAFLVSMISAIVLVAQSVGKVVGFEVPAIEGVMEVVNPVLALLVILGVVVDPTTKGVEDSERAKAYGRDS